MAKIVTITNPLTGQPAQVDQLDHTAQQIDDGLNIARGVSNPNLLDNWYFGNPINQRGFITTSTEEYTIDRWYAARYQTGTKSVTLNDGHVTISCDDSADGAYMEFVQYIESDISTYLVGKQITLSVLTKTGLYSRTFVPVDSSYHTFDINNGCTVYFRARIKSTADIRIRCYNGNSVNLIAVKLELGYQQTLAHQENGVWVLNEIPNYGEQLRRCQRYFWRSWTGERNTQNSILGVVFGNNHRITGFDYPAEMRTRPSITVYGLTGSGKVTEFASDADYGPASPAYWDTQRCSALACDGAGLSNDNRVYYFIEANAEL